MRTEENLIQTPKQVYSNLVSRNDKLTDLVNSLNLRKLLEKRKISGNNKNNIKRVANGDLSKNLLPDNDNKIYLKTRIKFFEKQMRISSTNEFESGSHLKCIKFPTSNYFSNQSSITSTSDDSHKSDVEPLSKLKKMYSRSMPDIAKHIDKVDFEHILPIRSNPWLMNDAKIKKPTQSNNVSRALKEIDIKCTKLNVERFENQSKKMKPGTETETRNVKSSFQSIHLTSKSVPDSNTSTKESLIVQNFDSGTSEGFVCKLRKKFSLLSHRKNNCNFKVPGKCTQIPSSKPIAKFILQPKVAQKLEKPDTLNLKLQKFIDSNPRFKEKFTPNSKKIPIYSCIEPHFTHTLDCLADIGNLSKPMESKTYKVVNLCESPLPVKLNKRMAPTPPIKKMHIRAFEEHILEQEKCQVETVVKFEAIQLTDISNFKRDTSVFTCENITKPREELKMKRLIMRPASNIIQNDIIRNNFTDKMTNIVEKGAVLDDPSIENVKTRNYIHDFVQRLREKDERIYAFQLSENSVEWCEEFEVIGGGVIIADGLLRNKRLTATPKLTFTRQDPVIYEYPSEESLLRDYNKENSYNPGEIDEFAEDDVLSNCYLLNGPVEESNLSCYISRYQSQYELGSCSTSLLKKSEIILKEPSESSSSSGNVILQSQDFPMNHNDPLCSTEVSFSADILF